MEGKDLTYWLNRRKEHEGLLVYYTLRQCKPTKDFNNKIKKISDELTKCTAEINNINRNTIARA